MCEAHGVGLSVEAFNQTLAKSEVPSYIWNSNEWLAAMMNWKVTKMTQTLLSIVVSDKDIFSKFLNGVVNAGNARGMKALVLTECEKGIKIETEMIGTVYHGGMQDCCSWKIAGEPNTELFISRPATVEVTCASAVTD